ATAQAANLLQSDCPTAQPLTVPGRLAAMEQRLDAMLRAVELVQPALERFYGALSDEQKERFNRLTPAQGRPAGRKRSPHERSEMRGDLPLGPAKAGDPAPNAHTF